MGEWEEYKIELTYDGDELPTEFGDLTEKFETELARLVRKYKTLGARIGLDFKATTSAGDEAREY